MAICMYECMSNIDSLLCPASVFDLGMLLVRASVLIQATATPVLCHQVFNTLGHRGVLHTKGNVAESLMASVRNPNIVTDKGGAVVNLHD